MVVWTRHLLVAAHCIHPFIQTYNCYGLEGIYCFGVNVTWLVSVPGLPLTAEDELSIDIFNVRVSDFTNSW
jgi:hypothetical protein